MTDFALSGSVIHGAAGQACTLDPDLVSTLGSAAAAVGRAGAAGAQPTAFTGASAGVQPFYKVAPLWVGFALVPSKMPPTARGYATGAALAGGVPAFWISSPQGSGASGASRASGPKASGGEFAFLNDKSLSIEDKLFMFMALKIKKGDQELVDKMNEYKRKKDDGGGFLGLGNIFGDIFGSLGDALKGLAGPAAAAVCTAIGLPELAPIAMKFGGQIAGQLADAAKGAIGGSGSGSGEEDEKLQMLELQRMVDKQNTMYAAVSNVLKNMHEAQMTAINNIR